MNKDLPEDALPGRTDCWPFDEVVSRFLKILEEYHATAYSYQPKTNSVLNGMVVTQAKQLYQEAIKLDDSLEDGRPVYAIAITNHVGDIDQDFRSAWEDAADFSPAPMLGVWFDFEANIEYHDVSLNLQFDNDENALDFAKRYSQKTVFKIYPDGRVKTLKTAPSRSSPED